MGFIKRIFGICETKPPADPSCWRYAEGRLELDLAKVPELAGSGTAVRLEGGDLPQRVLVVRGDDGEYHAFANKCTHGGRRIDPGPGQGQIRCCSVGKSTFDYHGRLISGSAKEDLPVLKVELTGGRLSIPLG